jgi:uncharacterized protein (DUF2062 family)
MENLLWFYIIFSYLFMAGYFSTLNHINNYLVWLISPITLPIIIGFRFRLK